MKNSVAILSHLKAKKNIEPTYERTNPGIREATGLSHDSVSNALCRLKQSGLIRPNPSKMLVGKRPNGLLRGGSRHSAYDITTKGIEYLEVRL